MSLFGRVVQNLHVWDARHFSWVGAPDGTPGGWRFEVNHAFFPLCPYLVNKLGAAFGDGSLLRVNFVLQMALSYLNTILIYRVGLLAFPKASARVAETAAYLYIFR